MSKRILLVDDEKDIIQVMRKKLQTAGYEVSVAYNGKDGLEITGQEHPHLIMTDVVMPVMDGFVFYQELQARADARHIPVIVASAHGTTEEAFRAIGVKDFLIKPFDTQKLLDTINRFFIGSKSVKVLLATKMIFLMRSILGESPELTQKLDLYMTKDPAGILQEALNVKPELIVLDVDMFFTPSAHEVVNELRQHPQLKDTLILLTRSMLGDLAALAGSRHSEKSIGECIERGASQFIGSLNKETLSAIMQEFCRTDFGK